VARDLMHAVFTLLPSALYACVPVPLLPRQLVFQRQADGRVIVQGFPDEIDVCEVAVGRLDPTLVRLEHGRL
jgi:hypothetical protein